MHTQTQALILAAGRGSRLGEITRGGPKCMLDVGGRPLIEHQVEALRDAGVSRICVVLGHGARHIVNALGDGCDYVYNERYADTNSLYSCWLARTEIEGPFVLVNADVLAHPIIYHRLSAARGDAIAYDSSSGHQDEHMKVVLDDGRLCAIGKRLPAEDAHGESLGLLRFSEEGAVRLFEHANALVSRGSVNDWAPAAVHEMARAIPIRGIDVCGMPWAEIDFPEDLDHARHYTWPLICANQGSRLFRIDRDGELASSVGWS